MRIVGQLKRIKQISISKHIFIMISVRDYWLWKMMLFFLYFLLPRTNLSKSDMNTDFQFFLVMWRPLSIFFSITPVKYWIGKRYLNFFLLWMKAISCNVVSFSVLKLLMVLALKLQWNSKKFPNYKWDSVLGREKDSRENEWQLIIYSSSCIHGTLQLLFSVPVKSGI